MTKRRDKSLIRITPAFTRLFQDAWTSKTYTWDVQPILKTETHTIKHHAVMREIETITCQSISLFGLTVVGMHGI